MNLNYITGLRSLTGKASKNDSATMLKVLEEALKGFRSITALVDNKDYFLNLGFSLYDEGEKLTTIKW
jgi:hypothetical protein